MTRIAYVVHGFAVGGIERCVAHLANHLDRRQFQPVIIALSHSGPAAEWIEPDDVPILELGKRAGNDPKAVLRLARLLREQDIDVVHSHNWGTLVETTVARRWAGVPVHVHSERGTVLGDINLTGRKRWLRSAAMRWSFGRVDAVVSNARATAAKVARLSGYPVDRIIVIPNGVACPPVADRGCARSQVRQQLEIAAGALVVGSVGRLVGVKNFGMAVDAVAQLQSRGGDVHLLLVGGGPEDAALRTRAASLGIAPRVHLVGHQSDVGRWLAAMDVYINCSQSEGMSQSIGEALALGLPLVVTDVGDNAGFLSCDPPCGEVVPAGDVASLSRALARITEHSGDMDAYGRAAAEQHRRSYSLKAMIQAYATLYGDLLQGRQHQAAAPDVLAAPDWAGSARPADELPNLISRGSAT